MTILTFFSTARKAGKRKGWSNQELSDFYRIHGQLVAAGFPVVFDQGETDEQDPWFIFMRDDTDEVIVHFARIDGQLHAINCITSQTFSGLDMGAVIEQMMTSMPIPPYRRREGNVVLHPRMVMTAFVASAFLMLLLQSENAQAADGRSDAPLDEDGRPLATQLATLWKFLQREGDAQAPTGEPSVIGSLALIAVALLTSDLGGFLDTAEAGEDTDPLELVVREEDVQRKIHEASVDVFSRLDPVIDAADSGEALAAPAPGLPVGSELDLILQKYALMLGARNEVLDTIARISAGAVEWEDPEPATGALETPHGPHQSDELAGEPSLPGQANALDAEARGDEAGEAAPPEAVAPVGMPLSDSPAISSSSTNLTKSVQVSAAVQEIGAAAVGRPEALSLDVGKPDPFDADDRAIVASAPAAATASPADREQDGVRDGDEVGNAPDAASADDPEDRTGAARDRSGREDARDRAEDQDRSSRDPDGRSEARERDEDGEDKDHPRGRDDRNREERDEARSSNRDDETDASPRDRDEGMIISRDEESDASPGNDVEAAVAADDGETVVVDLGEADVTVGVLAGDEADEVPEIDIGETILEIEDLDGEADAPSGPEDGSADWKSDLPVIGDDVVIVGVTGFALVDAFAAMS